MIKNNAWNEFWIDSPDSVHHKAEAQAVADEFIRRYIRTGKETVLDFGCGYGHVAEAIADQIATVYIWDLAGSALAAANARIQHPNVVSLNPDDEDAQTTLDLILANSVIQYMTRVELESWMARWASWLKHDGYIVLSDVITESNRLWVDTLRWWIFSARHRVFLSALRFSIESARKYRRTRQRSPIETVDIDDIDSLGRNFGLQLARIEDNLGYQKSRRTLILGQLVDQDA